MDSDEEIGEIGDKTTLPKSKERQASDIDEILEEFRKIRAKQKGTVNIKEWIEEGRR